MPCPSHPPWHDHSNYAWRRVQVYCISDIKERLSVAIIGEEVFLRRTFK
jgi:hypothetical protein